MAEQATPRAMIRAMLRGELLPRPLLLPIVFSLGARLENLSLRSFLANATKIANSQRQIRNVLGLDGVTCYFDPYLEAQAFGCEVKWSTDEMSRVLCPLEGDATRLWERLREPEEIAGRGRIPVACDVLRRLKLMLPREPALMAGVSGPCTLASQLMSDTQTDTPDPDLIEFATELVAEVCKSFLDSGANVIFIREGASIGDCNLWAELMSPVVNIIRFYEALPILLLGEASRELVASLEASCDGMICPREIDLASAATPNSPVAAFLPDASFLPPEDESRTSSKSLEIWARNTNVCVLTSRRDVPLEVDVKYLAGLFASLRNVSRVVA